MRMHCSMQLNIDSLCIFGVEKTIYRQHANNLYSKYAYQHIINNFVSTKTLQCSPNFNGSHLDRLHIKNVNLLYYFTYTNFMLHFRVK